MRIARMTCLAAFAVLAVACGKKGNAGGDGGAGGADGVKGLANAGNDAAIVAMAKKALACTWKADSLSFDTDCADWKAWTNSSDVFNTATSDATFVNMLEDPDVKVRVLATYHLGYDSERKWVNDPALSGRVIAAAAAETQSHYNIDAQGKAVARIVYTKSGNWAQAKAALDGTALKSMVRTALDYLLDYNETNAQVWDYVKSKTKDPDKSIAEWAVYGFGGLDTRKQDACKVFSDLLGDDRVGGDAASALALQSNECTGFLDATITAAEGRAKAGNASDVDWPNAMERVVQNVKASDAQKKKALETLNELATNTHIDGWLRASSLRDLWEVDHVKGKGLAARLLHDKDSSVASAAKDVMAKKA
jgi:hypothetical protein